MLKLLVDRNTLFVNGADGPVLSDSSPRENIHRLHHLAVGILGGCSQQADITDLDLRTRIGTACPKKKSKPISPIWTCAQV